MKVKEKLNKKVKIKVWNEDADILWVAPDLIELPVWQMCCTIVFWAHNLQIMVPTSKEID